LEARALNPYQECSIFGEQLMSAAAGPEVDQDIRRGRIFWIPIAGVILYVLLDAVVQLLPPHYSPIRDAESDLAVGPYGYIMTINFLNRGVLSLVFLYGLLKTVGASGDHGAPDARRRFRTGALGFGVWGVGAILLALFPTDVPSTPVSWHGGIHLVVAILAFLGGSLGALMLSLQFGGSRSLLGARSASLSIAVLSVIFLVILLGSAGTHVGGLTERVFLGSVLLWIAFVSAYLLRRGAAPGGRTAETAGPS